MRFDRVTTREKPSSPRTCRGFSRFELAIVVIVISLVALPLIATLARYQGVAERLHMENDVRDMQTFLNLKLLDFMLAGDKDGVAQLAGSNPVRLLERVPLHYRGEIDDATQSSETGWLFDRQQKMLVYRPTSSSFPYREGEGRELGWQLERNPASERSVRLAERAPNAR